MESKHECTERRIRDFICLTVGRSTDEVRANRRPFDSFGDTIWNQNLEVIEQRHFCQINRETDYFIESAAEYDEMVDKQIERYGNRIPERTTKELPTEKAAAILLNWVRRQPRCKTVKQNEIIKVVKEVNVSRISKKRSISYCITVRGQQLILK